MDPTFRNHFRTRTLSHPKLYWQIAHLYSPHSVETPRPYDQILAILDEYCINLNKCDHAQLELNNDFADNNYNLYIQPKCDRELAQELFNQCRDINNQASLADMIRAYIDSLQTAKLCLMRQQAEINRQHQKINQCVSRNSSYVFLKIVQASVYARYSPEPSFSYQIQSNETIFSPITMLYCLNPVLNHEYTLKLREDQFSIVFFQSGREIYKFTWPSSKQTQEGEYIENIKNQALACDMIIKYLPKGSNSEKNKLQSKLEQLRQSENVYSKALNKLCSFQPFLALNRIEKQSSKSSCWQSITNCIISCLPFMSHHVLVLYYVLLSLILVQALASLIWPMEMLEILIAFRGIAYLYDRTLQTISLQLWILLFSLVLCMIKSIWGLYYNPFQGQDHHQWGFLIFISTIWKLITIFFLWFCTARKKQIATERELTLYDKEQFVQAEDIKDGKSYLRKNYKNYIGNEIYEQSSIH